MAVAVLNWDQTTFMPPGGSDALAGGRSPPWGAWHRKNLSTQPLVACWTSRSPGPRRSGRMRMKLRCCVWPAVITKRPPKRSPAFLG